MTKFSVSVIKSLIGRLMGESLKNKVRKVADNYRSIIAIDEIKQELADNKVHIEQVVSLLHLYHKFPLIPPAHLQRRVAGAFYPEFFQHGINMINDMQAMLSGQGINLFQFNNMLDFGCGCGRFLIPLSMMTDAKIISGTDIDHESIKWMKAHHAQFKDLDVNNTQPPLKYGDNTFDFIFCISIFTHLPEDMQVSWLKELLRVMQPGGYGIFTVHGDNIHSHLLPHELAKLKEKGFYYKMVEPTPGLPDFYQTAFHTHSYIQNEWSRYFEILEVKTRGIGGHQDAVLLRKK